MSFPDPVILMRSFVQSVTPENVVTEIPENFDYRSPIVHVVDSGGPGVTNYVLDQRRVSFFVSSPKRRDALRVSETIRDALHDYQGGGWYWVSDTSAVNYFPDDQVKVPRYAYTARINTKKL